MTPVRRLAIFLLSVLTVLVVGILGLRIIRPSDRSSWPGRIAVIGLEPSDRQTSVTYLAVADPGRRTIVNVPPLAVIEIPGSGFLRAYHAWRLGRASLIRESLGRLFGVDVPFSISGTGKEFTQIARTFESSEVPVDKLGDLRDILDAAAEGWTLREVAVTSKEGARGPYLIPDRASVDVAARALGGLGTRVFVDPTSAELLIGNVRTASPAPAVSPTPTPPARPIPSGQITVEVVNGGEVELAATTTGAKLRSKGYAVSKIGDLKPQNRAVSLVYFRPGAEAKGRQVGAELGYGVEPLPGGLMTGADVLVVLGNDAQV